MSGMIDMNTQWILCPVCVNKTRDKIRTDTVLKNDPLYCPKGARQKQAQTVAGAGQTAKATKEIL